MDYSAGRVKEFIDRCHPFYYYEDRGNRDAEIVMYYRLALEDVRQYLASLLCEEVLEGGYTGAGVSLLLPLGDMSIHVGIGTEAEGMGVMDGKREPGIIYTPIGRIDMYIYREIIKENDNPVRMLYESMREALWLCRVALYSEFVWILNFNELDNLRPIKRINHLSEEYKKTLVVDDNFDIFLEFEISFEECQAYMKSRGRRIVKRGWETLKVKVALDKN